MIEANNCCVCCGKIIPEGYQCCTQCYEDNAQMQAVKAIAEQRKNKKKWYHIFRKRGKEMQIQVDKTNMRVENGQLIINITSDIEKVLNASKAQLVQLGTLKDGNVFKIGDKEFIVLEHKDIGVAVIQKDFAFSAKFGDCADWIKSPIRVRLDGEYYDFIAKEIGAGNIIPFERDLTSLDGLDDYGKCVDKISLLSVEEYKKYHKILGLKSKYPDWQWLITPYSTPSNDYVRSVCVVDCGGSLCWSGCVRCRGVRPFLILNPSILVQA